MCEFLVTFSDCFLVFVIFWRVVAFLKTSLIWQFDWRIKLFKTTNSPRLANLCGIHYEQKICNFAHPCMQQRSQLTHSHVVNLRCKILQSICIIFRGFIFSESGLHFCDALTPVYSNFILIQVLWDIPHCVTERNRFDPLVWFISSLRGDSSSLEPQYAILVTSLYLSPYIQRQKDAFQRDLYLALLYEHPQSFLKVM